MNVCPAVCTTTYEIVLNFYVLGALAVGLVAGTLMFLKKIKPWLGILLVVVAFVFTFLVAIKINACDSGCAKDGSIKFENELFGDKD